jgi:hypothetical protein
MTRGLSEAVFTAIMIVVLITMFLAGMAATVP